LLQERRKERGKNALTRRRFPQPRRGKETRKRTKTAPSGKSLLLNKWKVGWDDFFCEKQQILPFNPAGKKKGLRGGKVTLQSGSYIQGKGGMFATKRQ